MENEEYNKILNFINSNFSSNSVNNINKLDLYLKTNYEDFDDNDIRILISESSKLCNTLEILNKSKNKFNSVIYKYINIYNNLMNDNKSRLLTREEEKYLINRIKSGDDEALNVFVSKNLGLVKSICKNYFSTYLSEEDIFQEGCVGLIEAIYKFNPDLGFKFSSYATYWIKNRVFKSVMGNVYVVNFSSNDRYELSKNLTNINKIYVENGYNPDSNELSNLCNIPVDKVNTYLKFLNDYYMFSLDNSDDEFSLYSVVSDNSDDFDKIINDIDNKNLLNTLLERCHFDERTLEMINLKFGFYGDRIYSVTEIAKKYNITKQRVSKILDNAMLKLRLCAYRFKKEEINKEHTLKYDLY